MAQKSLLRHEHLTADEIQFVIANPNRNRHDRKHRKLEEHLEFCSHCANNIADAKNRRRMQPTHQDRQVQL